MKKRIFLIGPTAVGKTAVSIQLAQAFGGEILSMDSMQIYRGMDIGTAKATSKERALALHHLLDIAEPGLPFSVYDYQQLAQAVQEEVWSRGKLPIYVGGTGLYLNALLYGYNFAQVEGGGEKRRIYEEAFDRGEGATLYARLQREDPKSATKFGPQDRPRIIRALEILDASGETKSDRLGALPKKDWENLILQVDLPRDLLYQRINQRVEAMLEAGFLEEVKALLSQGLSPKSQAMQAIGYREVAYYLRGLLSKEEMIDLIQRFSRNYAKRQLTWFRKIEGRVLVDLSDRLKAGKKLAGLVEAFLKEESF